MKRVDNGLLVLGVADKVKKIMEDIKTRGGFIPANIELIESAIAEIDSVLNSDDIMNDPILSKAFEPIAGTYKKLREHYTVIMRNNNE